MWMRERLLTNPHEWPEASWPPIYQQTDGTDIFVGGFFSTKHPHEAGLPYDYLVDRYPGPTTRLMTMCWGCSQKDMVSEDDDLGLCVKCLPRYQDAEHRSSNAERLDRNRFHRTGYGMTSNVEGLFADARRVV